MDRALAMALIHPHKEGELLFGWTLHSVEIELNNQRLGHNRAHYQFSNGITIIVESRQFTARAAAYTRHFAVSVHTQADMDPTAFRDLVQLISTNETTTDIPEPSSRIPTDTRSTHSTLYVVPGHIGNLYDLSFRCIQVLRNVHVIVVEAGNEQMLVQLDEEFDIQLQHKTVLELTKLDADTERMLDAAWSKSQQTCLFGAGEGLPTVADPGWQLISLAKKAGVPIQTLAGGGALSAALMRLETNRPFSFWGVLADHVYRASILNHLKGIRHLPPGTVIPMPICLTTDEYLHIHWATICNALQGCTGTLYLMVDLTRVTEREYRLDIANLADTDLSDLGPMRKLVLVFDVTAPFPAPSTRMKRLRERLTRLWSVPSVTLG